MRLLTRSALAVLTAATLTSVGITPVLASSGDTKREIERIADEIDRLKEQVDQYAEDYAEALDNKAQLDTEVTEAEARVAAKQAEVDALNADLANMAVEAFVGGGGGGTVTTLLSGGQGPNDAVQRAQFSDVAYNTGSETTNDYEQKVRELDAERSDLDKKRQQVQALAEQIATSQANAEASIKTYQEKQAAAQVKYGQQLQAEQAAREAAAAKKAQEQIAKAQAAAAAQAPRTGSSGSDGGGRGGGTASTDSSSGSSSSGGGGGGGGGVDPSAGAGGGTSLGMIAVNAAMAQRGVPYKFAASSPGVAFDCSGLTAYAWGQAGVYLPHQSRAQYAASPHVSMGNLAPGDLIFYYSPISHVSIYIGGGMVVHAPATGDVVKTAPLSGNAVGATRPG